MPEQEPQYFKEFRERLDEKFEIHEPQYFKDFKEEFKDFVHITARSFDSIEKRMATKEDIKDMATKADIEMLEYELSVVRNEMATKDEVREILSHIGRYEVRAQNTEATVLEDHKPRLATLEKEVFA